MHYRFYSFEIFETAMEFVNYSNNLTKLKKKEIILTGETYLCVIVANVEKKKEIVWRIEVECDRLKIGKKWRHSTTMHGEFTNENHSKCHNMATPIPMYQVNVFEIFINKTMLTGNTQCFGFSLHILQQHCQHHCRHRRRKCIPPNVFILIFI